MTLIFFCFIFTKLEVRKFFTAFEIAIIFCDLKDICLAKNDPITDFFWPSDPLKKTLSTCFLKKKVPNNK